MLKEKLLDLTTVPAYLATRGGRRVHVSTVHRWRTRGVAGVRLETILIGRTRYTSAEALDRFLRRSTSAKDQPDGTVTESDPVAIATADALECLRLKPCGDKGKG